MIRPVAMSVVVCSSCGREAGDPVPGAESALKVALAAGWQAIPKVSRTGRPTSRMDHLCPDCVTEWTPRPLDTRRREKCPKCGREVPVIGNGDLADHPPGYPPGSRCKNALGYSHAATS